MQRHTALLAKKLNSRQWRHYNEYKNSTSGKLNRNKSNHLPIYSNLNLEPTSDWGLRMPNSTWWQYNEYKKIASLINWIGINLTHCQFIATLTWSLHRPHFADWGCRTALCNQMDEKKEKPGAAAGWFCRGVTIG